LSCILSDYVPLCHHSVGIWFYFDNEYCTECIMVLYINELGKGFYDQVIVLVINIYWYIMTSKENVG